MIRYNGYRMDSAHSLAQMSAMLDIVRELGTATVEQMAERLPISFRAVQTYTTYLCGIERLGVHEEFHRGHARPSVYCLGRVDAPLPLTEADEAANGRDPAQANQRTVGANDWPRGEHAHRSGLLAVLFPFARESTEEGK